MAWAVIDRQAPSAEDVTKNDPSSGEYKLIWAEEFDREGRLGLINHVPLLVRAEVEDLRGEAI